MVIRVTDQATDKQKTDYNKERRDAVFRVGDEVLLKDHYFSNAAKGINAKLLEKWVGPFRVKEVKAPSVYILEEGLGRRVRKVHVSPIKKYIPQRKINVKPE